MPIPVVCGGCQTRLNAPSAAAGKRVKCPKCQAVVAVPAAEAPPPPPPPPAGGAFDFGAAVSSAGSPPREERRRPRDEDDDRPRRRPRDEYEADEDDRPRRRGAPSGGGSKAPLFLILGGVFFLLLLCCGGPAGVYIFVIQPKAKEIARQIEADIKKMEDERKKNAGAGKVGALGWYEFKAADGSVEGHFPSVPSDSPNSFRLEGNEYKARSYLALGDRGLSVALHVVELGAAAPAERMEALEFIALTHLNQQNPKDVERRNVHWLGQNGQELRFDRAEPTTIRVVVVGTRGYIGQIDFAGGRKRDVTDAFFDNIRIQNR